MCGNNTSHYHILHIMIVNLYMFRAFIKDRIIDDEYNSLVVTMHRHRRLDRKPSSNKSDLIDIISYTVWAMDLYSTSALDLETTFCLLLH